MDKFHERMRNRGQGGFTLIELLVVVAILAVLGGAVIIGIGSLRGTAKEKVCATDKETIETAAEAYKVANGAYPANIDAMVTDKLVKKINAADWDVTVAADSYTVTPDQDSGDKYGDVAPADCVA